MLESVVRDKTVERFEATGWLVRACVYAGRRSSPDRWCLKAGTWALVEFKRPGKAPDIQQQREHDRLRGHGQRVFKPNTVAEGLALVDMLNAEIEARRGAPKV